MLQTSKIYFYNWIKRLKNKSHPLLSLYSYNYIELFLNFLIFLKSFLADTCPCTPVLDFWWHLLWGSKLEWVLPYLLFAEANVMYIPWDLLLVLHLLTSWQPACSRSLPHIHVQKWDLAWIRTGNHPDRRYWYWYLYIYFRLKILMV